MRIFLFLSFILILSGCTTVEVAREVTKATKSMKTSVDNMIKYKEKDEIASDIEKERKILKVERAEEEKLIKEQNKIIKINFLNKELKELKGNLGKPVLSRKDGNSIIKRFDAPICRLFLFFISEDKMQKIKYFEIRNYTGNLIIKKDEAQNCYKELNLF